jgi:hypothetical protein
MCMFRSVQNSTVWSYAEVRENRNFSWTRQLQVNLTRVNNLIIMTTVHEQHQMHISYRMWFEAFTVNKCGKVFLGGEQRHGLVNSQYFGDLICLHLQNHLWWLRDSVSIKLWLLSLTIPTLMWPVAEDSVSIPVRKWRLMKYMNNHKEIIWRQLKICFLKSG